MQATSFYVQKGWLMSDYQVNIRAQLENFSQIKSQLNTLERNPINIKIKLAPENVDFVNNIQSQFKQAGKSISNQFSTDIGQFTKYKESIDKQTRQSAATTKKWATEYVNNMTAANEKTVANFQNSWKKYYDYVEAERKRLTFIIESPYFNEKEIIECASRPTEAFLRKLLHAYLNISSWSQMKQTNIMARNVCLIPSGVNLSFKARTIKFITEIFNM